MRDLLKGVFVLGLIRGAGWSWLQKSARELHTDIWREMVTNPQGVTVLSGDKRYGNVVMISGAKTFNVGIKSEQAFLSNNPTREAVAARVLLWRKIRETKLGGMLANGWHPEQLKCIRQVWYFEHTHRGLYTFSAQSLDLFPAPGSHALGRCLIVDTSQ